MIRRIRLFFARRRLIAHCMREYGWPRRRAKLYVGAVADAYALSMGTRGPRC